jgi:hypothetical protein
MGDKKKKKTPVQPIQRLVFINPKEKKKKKEYFLVNPSLKVVTL